MRWTHVMPVLLCAGLTLGCASAAAQEKSDDGDRAAEGRRETEEAEARRRREFEELERYRAETNAAVERVRSQKARLERGVIPDLSAELHRAHTELESLAVQRDRALAELDTARRDLESQRARLAAQTETLERQGYGEKDPKRLDVAAQIESVQARLADLQAEDERRAREFALETDRRQVGIAETRTALSEAQTRRQELAEWLDRHTPRSGGGAIGTGRGAGGRFPRAEDPRADSPFERGRPPNSEVDRRIEGLERAVRELHALLERHGIDRDVRDRAERKIEERRRLRMPRFDLTVEEAEELRRLMALERAGAAAGPRPPAPAPRTTGPNLRDVRRESTHRWLEGWITRPVAPEHTGLSAEETDEMQALAKRMLELLEKARPAPPDGDRRPPPADRPPEPGRRR